MIRSELLYTVVTSDPVQLFVSTLLSESQNRSTAISTGMITFIYIQAFIHSFIQKRREERIGWTWGPVYLKRGGGERESERARGREIHKVHYTCTCICNIKHGNIIKCVNIQWVQGRDKSYNNTLMYHNKEWNCIYTTVYHTRQFIGKELILARV